MAPDDIRFASLKEHRGWYFVEYLPPMPNYPFSTLSLCVVEGRDAPVVASAMENEARDWIGRYPVPLLATAFSLDGSVLSLSNVRPIDHLVAWVNSENSELVLRWELVKSEVLPSIALDREFLRNTFADIPSKTGAEIEIDAAKAVAARKFGWWLVFLWAVVVPLGIAALEWWSDLLGLVVLAYAFLKAIIHALNLTGHLPKSARERERDAQDLRMRHHHYHCETNPEAFEWLKAENFRREEIMGTKAEASALLPQPRKGPIDA